MALCPLDHDVSSFSALPIESGRLSVSTSPALFDRGRLIASASTSTKDEKDEEAWECCTSQSTGTDANIDSSSASVSVVAAAPVVTDSVAGPSNPSDTLPAFLRRIDFAPGCGTSKMDDISQVRRDLDALAFGTAALDGIVTTLTQDLDGLFDCTQLFP